MNEKTNDKLLEEPTREEIDNTKGALLIEFGAGWCPICQAFRPQLLSLLKNYPQVNHLRIEDGKGKRLGRSFKVRLWPNLVLMRDGVVIEQLSRPDIGEVELGLERIVRI